MTNKNFDQQKESQDEFYTQISDIEKELGHYWEEFKDKIIYCNCDNSQTSHFWLYFSLQFEFLGLKKLIATHYDSEKPTYKLEMKRDDNGRPVTTKTLLTQNGDFRSPECLELLQGADIVVTTPPFSLFREYVAQLIECEKAFIIIGKTETLATKSIAEHIAKNKMRTGYKDIKTEMHFVVPEDYECDKIEDGKRLTGLVACWFTNFPVKKHKEYMFFSRHYTPEDYPHYDNNDAINVSKVKKIPRDYNGAMGVPVVSFLDKFNPEQFEILGWPVENLLLHGKPIYRRVLIKRKSTEQ